MFHQHFEARRNLTLDEELRDIKREIIESRGLIIKTNNLTNALAADLKSIGKRQQNFERRALWNSAAANLLFVVVVIAAVKFAWDARVDAVTSETRSGLLPDVPTMIESGVKDYVVNTWTGFIAPRDTPADIVERLNREFNRISGLPAVRDKLLAQGIELFPSRPPAALADLTRSDLALWVPIIKASGATAD